MAFVKVISHTARTYYERACAAPRRSEAKMVEGIKPYCYKKRNDEKIELKSQQP